MYVCVFACERTDGGEGAGEAEVVHCVQTQQMEKKLLLLFFTPQKGVALIQLPVDTKTSTCSFS